MLTLLYQASYSVSGDVDRATTGVRGLVSAGAAVARVAEAAALEAAAIKAALEAAEAADRRLLSASHVRRLCA